jgi:hypothetical protein
METPRPQSTKWLIGALFAAVLISELFIVRQNAQLKLRIQSESSLDKKMKYLRTKTDRTLYEASMLGRCQPFFASAQAAGGSRPLKVALYFSLEHDCMSCVQQLIAQWNDVVKSSKGSQFAVTGYTEVDGLQDEKILNSDLKPLFSIQRVDHIEQKLATLGVSITPVVFVSDAATGRILLTSAPLATEASDRSLPERLQLLLTPCEQ